MTTAAVAYRLIELCKEGKFIEAQQELYADDIISIDPDGTQTTGKTNMHAKEKRFLSHLEKIVEIGYSQPLIAGSYFSVILCMAIAVKGQGTKEFREICVYQVNDGKIVFEQFFRDVKKMVEA